MIGHTIIRSGKRQAGSEEGQRSPSSISNFLVLVTKNLSDDRLIIRFIPVRRSTLGTLVGTTARRPGMVALETFENPNSHDEPPFSTR